MFGCGGGGQTYRGGEKVRPGRAASEKAYPSLASSPLTRPLPSDTSRGRRFPWLVLTSARGLIEQSLLGGGVSYERA